MYTVLTVLIFVNASMSYPPQTRTLLSDRVTALVKDTAAGRFPGTSLVHVLVWGRNTWMAGELWFWFTAPTNCYEVSTQASCSRTFQWSIWEGFPHRVASILVGGLLER